MKKINLTKNKIALVDDEDFDKVGSLKWCFNNLGYAERRDNGKLIRMHTFIIVPPKGMMIDHINGNGLDNRRSNLRVCTKSQNMMNRGKTKSNTSGYKGVTWDSFTKKWAARIKVCGKNKTLGRFNNPKDAAIAYDKACKIYHGEFAKTNF